MFVRRTKPGRLECRLHAAQKRIGQALAEARRPACLRSRHTAPCQAHARQPAPCRHPATAGHTARPALPGLSIRHEAGGRRGTSEPCACALLQGKHVDGVRSLHCICMPTQASQAGAAGARRGTRARACAYARSFFTKSILGKPRCFCARRTGSYAKSAKPPLRQDTQGLEGMQQQSTSQKESMHACGVTPAPCDARMAALWGHLHEGVLRIVRVREVQHRAGAADVQRRAVVRAARQACAERRVRHTRNDSLACPQARTR